MDLGWEPCNRRSNTREACYNFVHPSEGIRNHQIDEAATENVFDHSAKKVRWIELAFGAVLNPGNDDVDEEKRQEKLERLRLYRGAIG